jgi:hypothetical protein
VPDPETINDLPVTVMAADVVPTVDSHEPGVVVSYPDWSKDDTRIVVYAIGNAVYKGKFAESREEAMADALLVHGRVFEANYVQGRAFFRVPKVKQ